MILIEEQKVYISTPDDVFEFAKNFNLEKFLVNEYASDIKEWADENSLPYKSMKEKLSVLEELFEQGTFDLVDVGEYLAQTILKSHKLWNTYDVQYGDEDSAIVFYRAEPYDAEDFIKFIVQYAPQYKDDGTIGKLLENLL